MLKDDLLSKVKEDPWRLTYHVMPETGWLNDPNGAIQFNGTYHLYYQYVPDNPDGGATHWGHVTSQDMVHFKQEPIFMSPTEEYDIDGVYSGSGVEKDGKIYFFYTGNVKKPGDYDYIFNGRQQNLIHVISKDGFEIEKREVVIHHDDFPEGFSDHIRDPKIYETGEEYFMLLGARTVENKGSIIVYHSKDLDEWTYKGSLLDGDEEQGYMWECPDIFDLDNETVLIMSPQGIMEEKYHYNNPHVAGYLLGVADWQDVSFTPTSAFHEFDRGFDFYAPHTFEDEKGRRIMWSWMGIGDTKPEYTNPTISRGWQHAMALPRELVVENGKIYQRPLEEYQMLRQNEQVRTVGEAEDLAGEVYELQISLDFSAPFHLKLRQDSELIYDGDILTLQHGLSGYGRRKRMTEISTLTDLQIFMDTSSMEIFVNDGEFVLTTRVYPEVEQDLISFDSEATGTITYWDLIK